jgi:hypothetical protein
MGNLQHLCTDPLNTFKYQLLGINVANFTKWQNVAASQTAVVSRLMTYCYYIYIKHSSTGVPVFGK